MSDETRALEDLISEIRYMNDALRAYTTAVTDQTIKSGHAEAAGRASAPFGSVGGGSPAGLVDQFGKLLKESTEALKEERENRRKSNSMLKQEWSALGEIQTKLNDIDKAWEQEKRRLAESTGLREKEIEQRKSEFMLAEKLLERNKLVAERDAELIKKGMAPIGDGESTKGILAQIKDHFIKQDPFTKTALTGLAVSGGIAAISFAIDAIKGFGNRVKEVALNMNQDIRSNLGAAYQAYGVGQVGAGGRFLGEQMTGMQQAVSKTPFFQAAGVSGNDFAAALTEASRRLGDNMANTVDATKAIADFTVRAHVAGVALKEYEDTVISLTHTAGIGIENQKRAKELADQIYETEKNEHLERGFLLNNIKSTYQSLATMGYTIDNVTAINVRFAKQIQEGTMSLNDIILYAKGMKDANQGQHLFALQAMQEYGTKEQKAFASFIEKKSGGDPLKAAMLLRGVAEGSESVRKELGDQPFFKTAEEGIAFYKNAVIGPAYRQAQKEFGVKNEFDFLKIAQPFLGQRGLAMPTDTLEHQLEFLKDPSLKSGKGLAEGPTEEQFTIAGRQLASLTTMNETLDSIYNTLVFDIANTLKGVDSTVMADLKSMARAGKSDAFMERYASLPREARDNPLVSGVVSKIVAENAAGLAKGMNVQINVDGKDKSPEIIADEVVKKLFDQAAKRDQIKIDDRRASTEKQAAYLKYGTRHR